MIIDPTNPDIVYVAALGHAFGPNDERGVFRTQDGGKTWKKVLYKNPNVGAIDLTIDPANPKTFTRLRSNFAGFRGAYAARDRVRVFKIDGWRDYLDRHYPK